MRYTIEARELSSESNHRAIAGPARTTLEASGPDDALRQYVRSHHSELVSHTRPQNGRGESVAMVKKDEAVYLLRIYAN